VCKTTIAITLLAVGLAGLACNYHLVEPGCHGGSAQKSNLQVVQLALSVQHLS